MVLARRADFARGRHRHACRPPRSEPTDNIGRATQPKRLQNGCGKQGSIAFFTKYDPLDVGADRFWDPAIAVWMKSPLEMIALDNDGSGDFPVATSLKLGSDVDQQGALLGGRIGFCGTQASQHGARPCEVPVQRVGSHCQ